jgi:Domain of unknown function (DUF397)
MSADFDSTAAEWTKSSYSGSNGGQCVEFSRSYLASGLAPVRDSKNPNGPALLFSTDGWSSFIAAVKQGELPMATDSQSHR